MMSRWNPREEKGATLIIVTAALLMLFGAAALAVDMSGLRSDIRSDRLAADAAATAGAAFINPFAGSQADQACEAAWNYLQLNLSDANTSVSPPNCTVFAGSCIPSIVRQATASAGPYNFTITHPVPDNDPLMAGQAINLEIDGAPCQRLGVEVKRVRDYYFAPVMGFDSGSTTIHSVARIAADIGEGEVVPLLVLEPTSCNALYASGQGGVTVDYYQDSPGFIVVDSDANGGNAPNNCTANRYAIDAQGNNNGWIRALPVPAPQNIPSAILSYALSGKPGTNAAYAYDPNDLVTPAAGVDPSDPAYTAFRLYPTPQPISRRITRAPIDWRYNCKSSYPDYLGWVPVDGCPDAAAPHIDQLISRYGGNASPMGISQRWFGTSGFSCSPATDMTVSGNWYVDCPGGFIVNGVNITFQDGDVVFDGNVDLRSSGTLTINPSPTADHVVYVRNDGNLLKGAQSSIDMERVFVYLAGGNLDLTGGDGGLTWIAPISGDFEDLALWAEADLQFQIGGQAGNTLTGTFFTPLSNPFTLTGQGGQFQTDAQFLTRRLEVKGQGEVKMQPDPTRQTLIPIRAVKLIR